MSLLRGLSSDSRIRFDAIEATGELIFLESAMELSLDSIRSFALEKSEYEFVLEEINSDTSDSDDEPPIDYSKRLEARRLEELTLQSSFVTGYSVFEFGCLMICDAYLKLSGSGLNISDIAGSGMERVKIVVAKICAAPHVFQLDQWKEILTLRDLRNVLAHEIGVVDLEAKHSKLKSLLAGFVGVQFVGFGFGSQSRVILSDYFVRHAFSVFRDFLRQLHSELEAKVKAC